MCHGNEWRSLFLIGQNFSEWLFIAGTCADNIHVYIQNYLDNGIFLVGLMIHHSRVYHD